MKANPSGSPSCKAQSSRSKRYPRPQPQRPLAPVVHGNQRPTTAVRKGETEGGLGFPCAVGLVSRLYKSMLVNIGSLIAASTTALRSTCPEASATLISFNADDLAAFFSLSVLCSHGGISWYNSNQ